MTDNERRAQGMAVRRSVLGEAHVNRATENASELTRDFQDFITRYAWGDLWSRPGLDVKTRSMLTIAMMAALGRLDELKLHLRATVNTGVSRDEVKEIFMAVAVYAGVPAANTAYHIASDVFAALDEESTS